MLFRSSTAGYAPVPSLPSRNTCFDDGRKLGPAGEAGRLLLARCCFRARASNSGVIALAAAGNSGDSGDPLGCCFTQGETRPSPVGRCPTASGPTTSCPCASCTGLRCCCVRWLHELLQEPVAQAERGGHVQAPGAEDYPNACTAYENAINDLESQKLYRQTPQLMTVQSLSFLLTEGRLDLAPDFQRGFVWKTPKQSRLV